MQLHARQRQHVPFIIAPRVRRLLGCSPARAAGAAAVAVARTAAAVAAAAVAAAVDAAARPAAAVASTDAAARHSATSAAAVGPALAAGAVAATADAAAGVAGAPAAVAAVAAGVAAPPPAPPGPPSPPPPWPPMGATAYLNASGAVTVAFECATDAAGLAVGAPFACDQLVSGGRTDRGFVAVKGLRCEWTSAATLRISAAAASVASRAGASVRALAVPVRPARPLACAGAARACAAAGEITVVASPEEVEPAPAPTISAPAVIGSCDNLTLVAQPQASGLSYTWSAASGDGGDGEPAFTKKLVGASGSRVVVPSHLFPSAGLFTFFLQATDARGYTGPVASLTVERSARPVPSVAIGFPQSRSRRRRSPPAPPPPPPRAPSRSSASPSRGRSPSPAAARPSRCPAAGGASASPPTRSPPARRRCCC